MPVQLAGFTGGTTTFHNRGSVHTLSNGAALVVLKISDTQLALYYSLNHTTSYTFKAVLTPASWGSSHHWASEIDESDNLHVLWINTSNQIKYVKFTESGFTWTAGSTEAVGTVTTAWTYGPPAIECLASGALLASWAEYNPASSSTPTTYRFHIRTTGGTWATQFSEAGVAPTGTPPFWVTPAPSIARDVAGAVSNQQRFAYLIGGTGNTPWKLGVKLVNISSGAVVSTTTIDAAAFGGSLGVYESSRIFSSASGEWTGVGCNISAPPSATTTEWAFRCSATAYTAGPASSVRSSGSQVSLDTIYIEDRAAAVWLAGNGDVKAHIACFTGSTITWLTPYVWEKASSWSGIPLAILAGGNRNVDLKHAQFIYLSSNGSSMDIWHHSSIILGRSAFGIAPANGSTVNSDTPTLTAYVAPGGGQAYTGQPFKGLWVIDTNGTFSASPVEIMQPDSAYVAPTTINYVSSQAVPPGVLVQGVWYVTVHAIDAWGNSDGNSDTERLYANFTVAHPPAMASLRPSSGESRAFGGSGDVLATWTFDDTSPTDIQTAYQLVVERNDTGAGVVDTGFVTSSATEATVSIGPSYKGMVLRVKGRLKDSAGVTGPWSNYGLFYVWDAPVVAVTAPVGTIATPSPTVTWTFTASGRTQLLYRVVFAVQSSGVVVHDSGLLAGVTTTYTPSTSILSNSTTYKITVTVYDNAQLAASDTELSVVTSWSAPDPVYLPLYTIDNIFYSKSGYVRVVWSNTSADATFYAWRVYRRTAVNSVHGTGTWVLAYETQVDQAVYQYMDYFAVPGEIQEWSVVQVATRFGALVESVHSPLWDEPEPLVSGDYWLLHPTDNARNVRLWSVQSDTHVDEMERAAMNLIGRGRHVDIGTRWGHKGTLKAQIRGYADPGTGVVYSARRARQALQGLVDDGGSVYLRNPFGDLWLVSLGDMDVERVPAGDVEFVDVEVPYVEVT